MFKNKVNSSKGLQREMKNAFGFSFHPITVHQSLIRNSLKKQAAAALFSQEEKHTEREREG